MKSALRSRGRPESKTESDGGAAGGGGGGVTLPELGGATTKSRKPRKALTRQDRVRDATKRFEAEKFMLMKRLARDKEELAVVEEAVASSRKKLMERQKRLAHTSAMFLWGPEKEEAEVEMHTSTGKAFTVKKTVQPLGRREAVAQVRRRIQKTLLQYRKDSGATEVKLNKTLDKNSKLREQINTLRREKVVFNKVFENMEAELEAVKKEVEATQIGIEEAYAARDICRREAQEVLERIQADKAEAAHEFARRESEITEMDKAVTRTDEGGAGSLSADQEVALRDRIRQSEWSMQVSRMRLTATKAKADAFRDALDAVRKETGVEDTDELCEELARLEEEKLEKAGATARIMEEIEAAEAEVQVLRREAEQLDKERTEAVARRSGEIEALQAEAEEYEDRCAALEAEARASQRDITLLLPHLQRLFRAMGCEALVSSDPAQAAAAERSRRGSIAVSHAGPMLTYIPPAATGGDESPRPPSVSPGGGGGGASAPPGSAERAASPASVSSASARRSSVVGPAVFGGSAAVRQSLTQGMTTSNVVVFVTLMDSSCADLVQRFAVMADEGRVPTSALVLPTSTTPKVTRVDSQASYSSHLSRATSDADLRRVDSSVPRAAIAMLRAAPEEPKSPVRIGPVEPSGALANSLTSSALLAAIIDPIALTAGEGDTETRPLSIEEFRAQAARSVESATFSLAVAASQDAAADLRRRHDRRLRRKAATTATATATTTTTTDRTSSAAAMAAARVAFS